MHYTIYDLPLSGFIQGYFLLKARTPCEMKLFGEATQSGPSINIAPWWLIFEAQRAEFDLAINQDSIPEMSENVGAAYIREIARCTCGLFVSINQEEAAPNAGGARQLIVPDLVRGLPGYTLRSRNLFWLRDGYVEEVYALTSQ